VPVHRAPPTVPRKVLVVVDPVRVTVFLTCLRTPTLAI
jgi:hypothetical protein